ncbi:MAG: hypothetical protein D6798_00535 [Deltaproteobacteria bacterium]|nr:MAG: hypothetical protein D6798_00535 [Deltaproteobacteria bacterium]
MIVSAHRIWRLVAVAAGLVVGFGCGWLLPQPQPQPQPQPATGPSLPAPCQDRAPVAARSHLGGSGAGGDALPVAPPVVERAPGDSTAGAALADDRAATTVERRKAWVSGLGALEDAGRDAVLVDTDCQGGPCASAWVIDGGDLTDPEVLGEFVEISRQANATLDPIVGKFYQRPGGAVLVLQAVDEPGQPPSFAEERRMEDMADRVGEVGDTG